jgi:hypothetical protein
MRDGRITAGSLKGQDFSEYVENPLRTRAAAAMVPCGGAGVVACRRLVPVLCRSVVLCLDKERRRRSLAANLKQSDQRRSLRRFPWHL